MRIARVDGVASPIRKTDGIGGHRIVIVATLGEASPQILAAADPLQAAIGDVVLISEGRAAGAAIAPLSPDSSQFDAAVIAIVRPGEVKPEVLSELTDK